jgi:hypothetical protein
MFMAEVEFCESCGVPKLISGVFGWEESGIISISYSPGARMVFYESGNIDNIFRGVGELIGISIEHIAMERKRRDTRKFMERVFTREIEALASIMGGEKLDRLSSLDERKKREVLEVGEAVNTQATSIGMVYGYGNIRFSELWELRDTFPWRLQLIRYPYSVIFFCADMLATVEAFEQRDMCAEYEEVEDDVYLMSVTPGEHVVSLKDRLKRKHYELKPGNVSYERCPYCGVPLPLSRCRWNTEEGTILDPDTGRRMAFFDPTAMDAVFDDLESELGEAIPEAIIEAQRRYGKLSMSSENWRRSGYDFKSWAAMRGLGNITAFKADEKRLALTLENPCMHLALVGMAIALYELAWGKESSSHAWHRTEDGDLVIEVWM